jgi:outer membrane protein, multidrug efflux system
VDFLLSRATRPKRDTDVFPSVARRDDRFREAVLSLASYTAGVSSYIDVLDAEQLLYPAETALAQTQRDQLLAVVNLYKALGGGWEV